MTGPSLRNDPRALRVRKRPVPVQVRFAREAGTCQTLEGPVGYEQGDALLQGEAGDRWPVRSTEFDASYRPVPPTRAGEDGTYQKRPLAALARRLKPKDVVRVGHDGDLLRGRPGDWLVEYGPGSRGIVAASVFEATYDVLGSTDGS